MSEGLDGVCREKLMERFAEDEIERPLKIGGRVLAGDGNAESAVHGKQSEKEAVGLDAPRQADGFLLAVCEIDVGIQIEPRRRSCTELWGRLLFIPHGGA